MHTIATEDVRPPSQVCRALSSELDDVLLRAMDRDPLRRYPTMRAFGSALIGFADRRTWHIWAQEFVGTGQRDAALERTADESAPSLPGGRRGPRWSPRLLAPAITLAAFATAAAVFVRARGATGSGVEIETAARASVVTAATLAEPLPSEVPSVSVTAVPNAVSAAPAPPARSKNTLRAATASAPALPRSGSAVREAAQPARDASVAPPPERGSNGVPIFD